MSVIIENMDMPDNCKECRFEDEIYRGIKRKSDYVCSFVNIITTEIRTISRLPECPLFDCPSMVLERVRQEIIYDEQLYQEMCEDMDKHFDMNGEPLNERRIV